MNPVQEGVLPGSVGANLLLALGLDEFFTRTAAAGFQALLPDALGSTLALTDVTGAVAREYTYEPFGATTTTGTPSDPRRTSRCRPAPFSPIILKMMHSGGAPL